ncbi:MAG: SMC-Scp complex subunit ScpB [Clostridiaceae bacterium]|nr:SMC-Scp complex subunit ScpB [Clostridiaceae bacterium]
MIQNNDVEAAITDDELDKEIKTAQPVILEQESAEDFGYTEDDNFPQIDPEDRQAAVEALLFAAGDPISFDKIRQITGIEKNTLSRLMQDMSERYARDRSRGIMLREADGKYTLSTKPGFFDIITRMFQPRHRPPLSQAAYETLAIIAYNQPVTRAQVEAVRGVNSDSIISRLIERNLIYEAGHLDAPGRPTLFATTEQFLLDVGLSSVDELPAMEMLMYGTLRDLESSLQEASGTNRDNQITIDQIVQSAVDPETIYAGTSPKEIAHDAEEEKVQ